MSDFLLELRCEEIPARMQAGARVALETLFREQMGQAGVVTGDVTVWSTPRRLALIARDLPEATEAVREETKGPATSAPEQALEGFLRKTGLTKDQLEVRDIKGKDTYFAVVEKPGRAVKDVLAEAIPAIVRAFPWPKSMRWGAASISTESLRWVRPLSGIVALFGEELVECEVGGIRSTYATKGHRFHHHGATSEEPGHGYPLSQTTSHGLDITIGSAADYQEKLRACHVIVDHAEREELIRHKARHAAHEEGLALVEDEGLVVENAGLTEWPVPLLGRFDESFLEVPPEVIQLTARTNQKYFICRTPQGELANAFVCTANIVALDGGAAIVAGNRKVLAARLSDARFFWEQDRRKTLAEHAKGLERITFHEKLGTVADKVERVAKLARWLVEQGIVRPSPTSPSQQAGKASYPLPSGEERGLANTSEPGRSGEGVQSLADLAEQAARLCKADLVTEMVGEFPELQGLMGGYYARAEGLPDAVADAIRDHYKPVGQGDEVPTAPVTVAVSLADKLVTLAQFFAVGLTPTGSKDPFALRRAALSVIQLLVTNDLRLPLRNALFSHVFRAMINTDILVRKEAAKAAFDALSPMIDARTWNSLRAGIVADFESDKARNLESEMALAILVIQNDLIPFFADRLKVQQREAGVRHDLIDAVFALGGEDDLLRLLARVHALQAFVGTEDGANLLAGYKRAANILKKEDWRGVEGEIARTGEEDPLANVDDPDLKAVVAAKMEERHRREKELSYTPEPQEKALMDALELAGPKAAAAVGAEDFAGAMAALASLRAPIDAFFDHVTVNDPDPDKRMARLALLDRFRVAVHNVADFSKVEG